MNALKSRLFRTCPKNGKIVGVRQPEGWARVFFPLIGLAALVWFLLRVVPKPSRAAYPCQRVAMPLASGFVLWLAGMAGASLAIGGARRQFRQARWLSGGLAVVIALVGVIWAVVSVQQASLASALPERVEYTPHPANDPIGTAKGLAPGRVVWVHDPQVTDWAGQSSTDAERWWNHVDDAAAHAMLSDGLRSYADASTDAAAWDAIFRSFNGGSTGFTPGEKIYIKINLTTSNAGAGAATDDGNYNWRPTGLLNYDSTGHAPQLMHALLDQLVNRVGFAQSDITIGDPTGLWINDLYLPLQDDFPDVNYLDNRGANGRVRAEFSTSPMYWSTSAADGKRVDYPVVQHAEADYVIDFAILKTHDLNGITVTAKNHFGSLLRTPMAQLRGVGGNWYNLHTNLPGNGVDDLDDFRALVDMNGHEDFGGKTVLYLIDAIFGGKSWNSAPYTWPMTPFNGDWPSSVFLSMDQVAVDSVSFDFLAQQWPDHALMNEGVQGYLHEMALANNPPSGTFYDPEDDGVRLHSQGVHEHWNNPVDKQYSRNLGTGDGIELVRIEKSLACGQQTILFVGSTNPLNASDQAMAARLSTAGYQVAPVSQSAARTIDANGKDLVIISDSVTSGNVNTKFRNVTVPVINWEPALFDDLGMTGTTANTDFGDLADQTQVDIVDASHPLAAGLPVGLTDTTNGLQLYFWGVPSASAQVVARPNGYPNRAAIFGYEAGAGMVGMNAPARRVGFFNGYGADFTDEGWVLFDAAVTWAAQCSSSSGLTLINGDTGEEIGPLDDGQTVNLAELPTQNINIRADVDPAVLGSVGFTYDGNVNYRTDNSAPYTLVEPGTVHAPEWTPEIGSHTLTVTPYAAPERGGRAGQGLAINFTVTNTPLPVTLASFAAQQQGDAVQVTWETVSELNHAGFNLYRSLAADGERTLLAYVPASAPGSTAGAAYSWRDPDVVAGQTYWYLLEDIDLSGATSLHGPVSVAVQVPTAVALAGFEAESNDHAVDWAAPLLLLATAITTGAMLRWQFLTRRSQRRQA